MKWPNSTTVTPAKGRSVLTGSRLHEGVPVRRGDGAIEVAEAAFVLHLARGVEHPGHGGAIDRKSTRLNSSHTVISYAVFCLKKKKTRSQSRRSCDERIADCAA